MAKKEIGLMRPRGFKSVIGTGLTAGASSGALAGVITMLTGSVALGEGIGGTIVAAALKDEVSRKVVAINSYHDAIFSLLALGR